jgi:ABC-type amino acid transport substrate-binding protein
VGYGDKVPHTRLGKAFGIIWIFVGIILFSLFTANASAIFTTKRLESHVETVEDLRRVTVGAVWNSSGAEFLEREQIRYRGFDTMEDVLDALLQKKIDCIVNNVPVLRYYNRQRPYFAKIAISNRLLLKNNMGIALPENSPLREEIDLVLLEKLSEPKWQQILFRYLGED